MKVLLVNKFHYLKGGSEKYYFDLAKLLQEHGHEVAFFSMQDEKNIKTDCKEYFVENSDMNSKNPLKAFDIIYSRRNKKVMEKALDDFKPDIVHLNNFQRQLSASIIKPIKKRNIPIVFTAHDLQAICPKGTMLDNDKCICEKCLEQTSLNCLKKRCIKHSYAKSLLASIENKYYKQKKIYTKFIDYIISPSQFLVKKFINYGVEKNKISCIHNFTQIPFKICNSNGNYILYFGRISKEKGIYNLLKAFSQVPRGILYIAGTGPDVSKIRKEIKKLKIGDRIKLLGYLNQEQLKKYINNCRFVVVPSTGYENCPYSILETLSAGKTVLASNIGGIPELIIDNETGLLFETNNIEDLEKKMNLLLNDDDLIRKLEFNARKHAKQEYNKDIYYKKLINIYYKLINGEKNEG